MSPRLVAELSAVLKQPPELAEKVLAARLAALVGAPPSAELLEIGARARQTGASDEELALAVATLFALYAPPAGAVEH